MELQKYDSMVVLHKLNYFLFLFFLFKWYFMLSLIFIIEVYSIRNRMGVYLVGDTQIYSRKGSSVNDALEQHLHLN